MVTQRYKVVAPELVDEDIPQASYAHNQTHPIQKPLADSSERLDSREDSVTRPDNETRSGYKSDLIEKSASHEARILSNRASDVCLRAFVDVCLAIVPCLFISLGVIAISLNGQSISSYGGKVEEASRLGPTIFPIAFAAIVSRFNKHLARWQAERGQRLGVLEQLIQSTSFAGSIEAAYGLRSMTITSIAIALLWGCSPIGGQSSLRVLSVAPTNVETQNSVYGATGEVMGYFGGMAHQVTTQNVINALITASLLAPESTRLGPTDAWGNIKIPASHYVADLDTNEWYTADEASDFANYSSLLGIPIWSTPDRGYVNFTIVWPIYDTDCVKDIMGYNKLEWCYFTINQTVADANRNQCKCEVNTTAYQCDWNATDDSFSGPTGMGQSVMSSESITDSIDTETQVNSSSIPRYMDIVATLMDPHEVNNKGYPGSKTHCKLRTTHVEVGVFCDDGSCRATKIRRTNDPKLDFINPWNNDSTSVEMDTKLAYFSIMLDWLPLTTGQAAAGTNYPSPFDAYLNGYERPFDLFSIPPISWGDVTDADFSQRLSVMLNTFWLAAQWNKMIPSHSNDTVTDLFNETSGELLPIYQQSLVTIVQNHQIYRANYGWITALIIVSVILLLCAFASLFFGIFIIAPDILGFVSSFTRDSPYFEPLPPGGSLLGGEQRARKLRDMRVQILDVRPKAEVGHIAFARAESASGNDQTKKGRARIVKGRLYD